MAAQQKKQKSDQLQSRKPQPVEGDHAHSELSPLLAAAMRAELGDGLPEHPTSLPLRRASLLQRQQTQGNTTVVQLLARRAARKGGAAGEPSSPALSRTGPTPMIQRSCQRRGRGYQYSGSGSEGFVTTQLNQAIEHFRDSGHHQLATACEVFLRLSPMEGWISAINTWESQMIFTWGTGFAAGGMLNIMWQRLDPSVKGALAGDPHTGRYFSGGSLNISDRIRTDREAIHAIIRISESPAYRGHLLRAQLNTFMTETMGIETPVSPGERHPAGDPAAITLATHLSHWLPNIFSMPGGLDEAVSIAGGGPGNPPERSALIAAIIRLHGQRMLDSGAFGRPEAGRRRIFREDKLNYGPMLKYTINLRNLFETRATPLTVSSEATAILPCFTSGSQPFFNAVFSPAGIPEEHYVMIASGRRHYDFGPRS